MNGGEGKSDEESGDLKEDEAIRTDEEGKEDEEYEPEQSEAPDKEKSHMAVEEDPIPDQRLLEFQLKSEEQKDMMSCDEVFCMYLREISK